MYVKPFLQHLHRGGAAAYYHELPTRRSWWFEAGKPLAPPKECDANWYFGVHPCTAIPPCNAHGEIKPPHAVRAQKRYIAAINCLYAEFDAKTYGSKDAIAQHLEASTFPEPSVLIDSGGGLHGYWLLRDPYMLDTDERRQMLGKGRRFHQPSTPMVHGTVAGYVKHTRYPAMFGEPCDPCRLANNQRQNTTKRQRREARIRAGVADWVQRDHPPLVVVEGGAA